MSRTPSKDTHDDLLSESRVLREKLRRYQTLTENAFDLVCELDVQGHFLYMSPNYRDVLGWEPDEYLGTECFKKLLPEDKQQALDELEKTVREGHGMAVVRARHADDSWRWFEVTARTHYIDTGAPRVVLISRDITARRKAEEKLQRDIAHRQSVEQELRESQHRLQAIAEAIPIPVVISRISDGLILDANTPTEELIGVLPGELVGRNTTEFYADLEDRKRLVTQLHRDGLVTDFESRLKKADGTPFWVSFSSRPITYRGHDAALTGFIDLTQRKADEERLQRDRRLLKQLLDLRDRDRKLVAYEIHDGVLQDMIGAMMHLEAARVAMPKMNDKVKEKCESVARLLQNAINEGRRLINGLQPPLLEEAGVVAAIEDLVENAKEMADLKVEFRHDVQFRRMAPALENAIYRIVQEALANVHRHSGCNRAEVALTQYGDAVDLTVRDEGVGFDPETRAGGQFGLTGLRQRARLLGGTANIESKPGEGAIVSVRLPLTEAYEEA